MNYPDGKSGHCEASRDGAETLVKILGHYGHNLSEPAQRAVAKIMATCAQSAACSGAMHVIREAKKAVEASLDVDEALAAVEQVMRDCIQRMKDGLGEK